MTKDSKKQIIIKGAKEHNLQNIDLAIPRDEFIVITGLSGSGKSSLAFDTIYAEGQRRYVESLSAYARQFLGQMKKPEMEYIEGLSPAISIDQKTTKENPRSTVGTITEIYDYLRLLYARIGIPHCPKCGKVISKQSVDQIVDQVMALGDKTKIQILAPIIRGKKGTHEKVLDNIKRSGFVRARVDGSIYELTEEEVKNVNAALKGFKEGIEKEIGRISEKTKKLKIDNIRYNLFNITKNCKNGLLSMRKNGYIIRFLDVMISIIKKDSNRLSEDMLNKVVSGKYRRKSLENDLNELRSNKDLIGKMINIFDNLKNGSITIDNATTDLCKISGNSMDNDDGSIKGSICSAIKSICKLLEAYRLNLGIQKK